MVSRIFLIAILFSNSLLAQKKQCGCSTNIHLNENTTKCTTTTLKNGSKLYWQFNCNSIWLTLENNHHKKMIIDRVDTIFHNLTYRLGFNLVKEFKTSLLFRYSCPANGPCNYILINKYTGHRLKKFGVLINQPEDDYNFNFVAYLSDSNNKISIYFPNSKKTLKTSINKNELFYATPEYQFENIELRNNIITLTYETSRTAGKSIMKTKSINIAKYNR